MKKFLPVIFAACFLLNGCSAYKIYITPAGVTQLPGDNRVWFEDGARDKAILISSILDERIDEITKKHYRPFRQPVIVYVFSRQETYENYALQPKSGGEAHGDKIIVSPKKANTGPRIPGLVAHELSHYHIFGYLDEYRSWIIPAWYLEGLAVWASNGVGAERVSRELAISEILAGRHLSPVTRRPVLFGEKSRPSEMQAHMFYRQSAIFVEYLHDMNPDHFRELLLGVEDSKDFKTVFEQAYKSPPEEVWLQFTKEITE